MKIILNILGTIFLIFGIMWVLQGINILPGSFMTGHIEWAYYGILLLIVGSILLLFNNRHKNKSL